MTLDHTVATMYLDTFVEFIISLVTLLRSLLSVVWHEEHLWNFSVLQRVHISNLVLLPPSQN
jgi:hypothetical protein